MQFSPEFAREFEQLLKWRRDVRRFRDAPVDEALIRDLLVLADHAPSVGLSQPWRFVSMEQEAQRALVRASFERCNAAALEGYSGQDRKLYATLKLEGLREAPVQFAVFADETTRKGKGLGAQTMPETLRYSTVMAVHTFWLAARIRGLGVGWVSILEPDIVRKAANAPSGWALVAYLCVGWPQEESDQPELERAGWEVRTLTGGTGPEGTERS
ncbi:MAG: 5,6-dimethylbenzimidazole synthase [Alphaproteobacteria bacterium]|nr:MAG: 5,6-dimethylbenzimidazole synthase [Alphaproteobacteria bacterium]